MRIDVREIPEEGMTLRGESQRDIFELGDDMVRPDGPLRYDLRLSLVSEGVLVQGRVSTGFLAVCVRCLEPVRLQIELDDCIFHLPVATDGSIDLTESIREDILLALPVYPHCEEGTPPRPCPLTGQFEDRGGLGEESRGKPPGDRSSWSTLEGFNPLT